MSTITLSLSIGGSRSINEAYPYGLPGDRGSRTVRAAFGETSLLARVGVGRGRGATVSYTLYVEFPESVYTLIPNARALRDEDGKDRTRSTGKAPRVGRADYLFEITREEYNALVNTATPEIARVEVADRPEGEIVGKPAGIAIPTRYVKPEETEGSKAPTLPSDNAESPEPVAARPNRRRVTASAS